MITFKQFLEEKEAVIFEELLHGDCKDFFQRSRQNGLLVRGINGGFGQLVTHTEINGRPFTIYKKTVRKNRKPMDTTGALHKIIDDWFEEEMGIRARSEAVFCFGEAARNIAYEYGTLCVVLPIGKFTYVWSPKVPDLYNDVS